MSLRTIRAGATAMTEASFLQLVTDLLTSSGVYDVSGTQFQVTGSGSNLSVNTAAGRAYLLASGGNGYPVVNDAAINTAINTNSSGNPRITSIVLYANLSATPNSDASNVCGIMAVDGTPASSPSAPSNATIQSAVGSSNPFIILANVLVTSGASVITNGNITDQRTAVQWLIGANSGWFANSASLTYASTDGHIFVVNTSVDLTGVIGVGDRIKVTNQSATQYFLVHAVTSSSITLYGGTNYSLINSTISNFYYSHAKSPFGFSLDPDIWSEEHSDINQYSNSGSVAGTWYNPNGTNLVIPIGMWRVYYEVVLQINGGGASVNAYCSLSTSASSPSDVSMTSMIASTGGSWIGSSLFRERRLSLASKTTYYLIVETDSGGTPTIFERGDIGATRIRAVNAYL